MPFLELFGMLIANALPLDQSIPDLVLEELPLEQLQLAPDTKIQALPFVLEGSVESFDPVERAEKLEKKISRKWCGTYRSFKTGSNLDVTLFLSQVKSIGQIVAIQGDVLIDQIKIKFSGNLNAKSKQTELIFLSTKFISDIEPGGIFLGLEGAKSFVWKPSRLNHLGGRLDFNKSCEKVNLKTSSSIFPSF